MSQGLSREIKKLKVRLNEFTKEEKAFLKSMENCVRKLEELDHYLKLDSEERDVNRLIKLHREACEAFREALEKHSGFEHEKSHLLESYGAILAAMERNFTDSLSQNYD
jgi:hypothetical protein